jgi:hypothetical protein
MAAVWSMLVILYRAAAIPWAIVPSTSDIPISATISPQPTEARCLARVSRTLQLSAKGNYKFSYKCAILCRFVESVSGPSPCLRHASADSNGH